MSHYVKIIFVSCLVILPALQASISIVYNLRVAETSKRQGIDPLLSDPWLGAFTLFNTYREKYNGVKHDAVGGLFTFDYTQDKFFVRVDAAVARVMSNTDGVKVARTQGDDILFSGGYSKALSEKLRLTLSGLVGFPTHNDTSLQEVQFGYGHYGIGAQLDGAWVYSKSENHTLRGAARYVHFFPRNITIPVNDVCTRYKYGIGNVADLFIAFHSKIKKHSFEIGYNPSFFFGARICPAYDDAVTKTNYIRNNFYGFYKYRFKIHKSMQALTFALSGGFEPTPKVYGNKRIILFWTAWGVNF